jgi:hypothetical protein
MSAARNAEATQSYHEGGAGLAGRFARQAGRKLS